MKTNKNWLNDSITNWFDWISWEVIYYRHEDRIVISIEGLTITRETWSGNKYSLIEHSIRISWSWIKIYCSIFIHLSLFLVILLVFLSVQIWIFQTSCCNSISRPDLEFESEDRVRKEESTKCLWLVRKNLKWNIIEILIKNLVWKIVILSKLVNLFILFVNLCVNKCTTNLSLLLVLKLLKKNCLKA